MCGHYSRNRYNGKTRTARVASNLPACVPQQLASSVVVPVQWCSKKEQRRGPPNSLQPAQPTGSTDGVTQELEAAIAMSREHGGRPCSSRTRAVCFPFWWWFSPLTHRLPCPLLLTSAAIVTVCFQQRKSEEKPLWAFGSVWERLTAGARIWTGEPAVSTCCQQSWLDSCWTSCALHVLMARRRQRGHLKMKDSSCFATHWRWSRCGCLGNPSLRWLPPRCQLSGHSRRSQLSWPAVRRKHKVNSGVGMHSSEVFYSFLRYMLITRLLLPSQEREKFWDFRSHIHRVA